MDAHRHDDQQTIDVVTPAAGESVTEGTILEWHVKVGDFIKVDDTIVEISTDKVDVELPSPGSGTVVEILAEEGETVTVGQVIARIARGPRRRRGRLRGERPAPLKDSPQSSNAIEEDEQAAAPRANGAGNGDGAASGGLTASADAGAASGRLVDVVTPAAGESVTEGTILEWRVKPGELIKADATIVEISTDKVDVELPAPASGTVSGAARRPRATRSPSGR